MMQDGKKPVWQVMILFGNVVVVESKLLLVIFRDPKLTSLKQQHLQQLG